MVVNPRNIVIRRLEEDNTFHIYFPQTLVEGFQDKDDVYKTHWTDMNVHVSNEDRVNVFNKSVVLDQDGRVPENILSKAQRLKVKDFANFAALKEAYAAKTVSDNEYVMVTDASDKPTDPHTGWEITAIIPPKAEGGEPTFRAISTSQLVDYVVSANTIEGRYTSTSEQIDALVANDHTHANLAVLDTLTEDTFKQLAKKQDFQAVKYGENAIAMDNAEGDMIFNVTGILADPTTPPPAPPVPPAPPAAPEEHREDAGAHDASPSEPPTAPPAAPPVAPEEHREAPTTGEGTAPAAPAPTGTPAATGSEEAPLHVESQPVAETHTPEDHREEPAAAVNTGNTETAPTAPPTAAPEEHREESGNVSAEPQPAAPPATPSVGTEEHREDSGTHEASPSDPTVAPPAASEERREEPAAASAEHGETTPPAAPPVASPATPEEHREEPGNVSAEPQPAAPPTAAPEEHHENPTGEGPSPVASPATSEEHHEETATTVNAGDAETATPAPTGAPTATGSEEAPSHVESQPVAETHTPEESAPQA